MEVFEQIEDERPVYLSSHLFHPIEIIVEKHMR